MPENKYTPQIQALEKAAQFDADVRPVNPRYVKEMNPDKFKYKPKNPLWRLYELLVRLLVWVLGPFVTWFYFDLRVRGKKHLKALKRQGAIVVSNHVHTLDALYLRQVSRTRGMYYLAAPFNNKKGLAGLTLRVGGILPIGRSLKLARQLDQTITELLHHKCLVTVYAEESLWLGYTKIRPLKKGAFHYAAKNNSPVLPVVALFRPTNWWDKILHRKYKVTLQILPPIFPKPDLDRPDNITYLQQTCHQAMVACANAFYGCECDAEKLVHEERTAAPEPSLELSDEMMLKE